jgi:hypothetical protein
MSAGKKESKRDAIGCPIGTEIARMERVSKDIRHEKTTARNFPGPKLFPSENRLFLGVALSAWTTTP